MKHDHDSDLPASSWSRRDFVSLLAGAPLIAGLANSTEARASGSAIFPAKSDFDIRGTYLNAAYTHPMSKGSLSEVKKFLNERMLNRQTPKGYDAFERKSVVASFAKLINASPEEIAWVPSTMVGENLLVNGLSLPGSQSHVITDAFHFQGSLHMYHQLARQGLKVTVIKPRDNHIDMNDMEAAITPDTKLIALSLVSATTGFQHDLKKVCDLAHARGVLVYADIIQAAGAVPIDVRDSQVDFCATATYKWLMGDFGIGFLYVRKDRLPFIKRTLYGYRQIDRYTSHFLPFDSPGENVLESEAKDDMSGHFEVGTFANEGIAALRYSLDYLNRVGVENIQKYRQPMIDRLQQALPRDKYLPLTPANSSSPIVCFAFKNALALLKPRLDAADINIQLYENMIRISPSFYNDMDEVEKLIEVLKSA
jgi:selenocysteine lyase/cysteine desulfurase